MPKKCSECEEVKEFTDFNKQEGSNKYQDRCRSCTESVGVVAEAHLNPAPDLVKRTDADRELARRKEQYRRSIAEVKRF